MSEFYSSFPRLLRHNSVVNLTVEVINLILDEGVKAYLDNTLLKELSRLCKQDCRLCFAFCSFCGCDYC